jgi:RHS repeat-associated protein
MAWYRIRHLHMGFQNDMTSATIDSATATYGYDPSGLRDSRTFDSTTTHYTWTWGSGLPVILCDGSTHFIYGNGRIMATDGSGNVEAYYLYDGLGSVANVTDANGDVLVTYTYDAFGGIRTQSAASDNYWTFTGEQTDEESGFQYLRARYYDVEIGRFISNDPLGGGYPYAGSNPVNATDPTGLCPAGAATSWASSDGSTACYDGNMQLLSCTGVCPNANFHLSSPNTITEAEFQADLNARAAPIDKASKSTVVVVGEAKAAGKAPPGSTSVVKITAPNTGEGLCPDSEYECEVLIGDEAHGIMECYEHHGLIPAEECFQRLEMFTAGVGTILLGYAMIKIGCATIILCPAGIVAGGAAVTAGLVMIYTAIIPWR